jgi:hypothetical protein
VVGVPLRVPDAGSIARPAGRPVADQVSVALDEESVAVTVTGVMAEPDRSDWSPGPVTETSLAIVHSNDAESEYPAPSVAVRVTDDVPAVVGVPETVPSVGSTDRPPGRPVADQVSVAVDEESVADAARGLMAMPEGVVCAPGSATVTTLVTVQPKEADPAAPDPSVAVTVTDEAPAVVGEPEMAPEAGSIESPAGRPVADQVSVAVDEESVAATDTTPMADPDTSVWSPGLVTDTVFVVVHVSEADPDAPELSVAVSVTEQAQAVVGVPLIVPVVELIDSPAGRPVADQVNDDTPVCESVAESVSGVMVEPVVDDWAPGLVTATLLVTVQVIEVVPK